MDIFTLTYSNTSDIVTNFDPDMGISTFAKLFNITNQNLNVSLVQDWGGGIGKLSSTSNGLNVIDAFDGGRLIQQAYYGAWLDSDPAHPAWDTWDPVQGIGTILEIRVDGVLIANPLADHSGLNVTGQTLYLKIKPRLWGISTSPDPTCYFEQWIIFEGPNLRIKYKFTYTGPDRLTRAFDAEAPCFYVTDALAGCTGVYMYRGTSPWTNDAPELVPFCNTAMNPTECWAAMVNSSDFGIGCYNSSPLISRYQIPAISATQHYMSPITTIPGGIASGQSEEFTALITLGSLSQIRSRFYDEYVSEGNTIPPANSAGNAQIPAGQQATASVGSPNISADGSTQVIGQGAVADVGTPLAGATSPQPASGMIYLATGQPLAAYLFTPQPMPFTGQILKP